MLPPSSANHPTLSVETNSLQAGCGLSPEDLLPKDFPNKDINGLKEELRDILAP
jgi:hypothetical protein